MWEPSWNHEGNWQDWCWDDMNIEDGRNGEAEKPCILTDITEALTDHTRTELTLLVAMTNNKFPF